eukprot:UN25295
MRLAFCVLFVALIFAKSLEKENKELSKTNEALLKVLKTLSAGSEGQTEQEVAGGCYTTSGNCKSGYYKLTFGSKCCPNLSEEDVGFYGTYKCIKRNECISECQTDDESKTWYDCMKECPKSLCDQDAESDSVDPEEDDSEEEAVGLTCSVAGFEGTVTTDSWCDKRDGVWMHKCSGCKHGYYWYWWHTYCCTRGKGGCTCAYN